MIYTPILRSGSSVVGAGYVQGTARVWEAHRMKGFLQTIFIFSAVLATGKFKLLLYYSPNLKLGVQ